MTHSTKRDQCDGLCEQVTKNAQQVIDALDTILAALKTGQPLKRRELQNAKWVVEDAMVAVSNMVTPIMAAEHGPSTGGGRHVA